jgi:hypothetical protein
MDTSLPHPISLSFFSAGDFFNFILKKKRVAINFYLNPFFIFDGRFALN